MRLRVCVCRCLLLQCLSFNKLCCVSDIRESVGEVSIMQTQNHFKTFVCVCEEHVAGQEGGISCCPLPHVFFLCVCESY